MRSRLLTILAGLALAMGSTAVVTLLLPATPASAHCSGHGTHPDLYSAGGISFSNGTRIRTHPHTDCTILGLGYPSHGIDVHCATETGSLWLYVRDTTTGVNGWGRFDAFNYAHPVLIPDCANGLTASTWSVSPTHTYQRA
ncbi:MAG: hypothetical protein ACM30G_12805 [Micromonosporaceae bacterium]